MSGHWVGLAYDLWRDKLAEDPILCLALRCFVQALVLSLRHKPCQLEVTMERTRTPTQFLIKQS